MSPPPTEEEIVAHFREQAAFCQFLGSPFTAALCTAMAADIEAGGPVAQLTANWPGDPRRDALSLRIAGYLHHSVLAGEADDLSAAYPGTDKAWSIDRVWPVVAEWLDGNAGAARAYMASPPQTNEVRRSIALLPGFLQLAAKNPGPMHLLELGASAGLNQNWDQFSYTAAGWSRQGTSGVLIDTDWRGGAPEFLDAPIEIASRAACDQHPIDVSRTGEARRLKSYVWSDQPERLARLDAAIALALSNGTKVDKGDAADWLEGRLAARPEHGLTVVYHSVFLQYPPASTLDRIVRLIEAAGAQASAERPLAWLCLEPRDLFNDPGLANVNPNLMVTRLKTWPDGAVQNILTTDGHVTRVQLL
jgi:hypothetical protein